MNPTDETPRRNLGGLWGRLRGAYQALTAPEGPPPPAAAWATADPPPVARPAPPAPAPEAVPVALPVAASEVSAPENLPVAEVLPTEEKDDREAIEVPPAAAPTPTTKEPTTKEVTPVRAPCPACQAPRAAGATYCPECGFLYPLEEANAATVDAAPATPNRRIAAGRYEILEPITARGGLCWYRGLDHGTEGPPTPVILVEGPDPVQERPVAARAPGGDGDSATHPDVALPPLSILDLPAVATAPAWPSLSWEWLMVSQAQMPALPLILTHFTEGDRAYLVEEGAVGTPLWDAWDDPEAPPATRFGWLTEIAEALQALAKAGAIVEQLRPENVVITADGHARLTDLSDLIPLPPPPDLAVRAGPSTAPELYLPPGNVDARASHFAFGALLYALYLGRELTELDFERQGVPKPFVFQFPDAHPLVGRLLMKTFVREPLQRFPSDEAYRDDATGFTELIAVLQAAGAALGLVRLDIASWTTTGIARTGNEDAFGLIHAAGGRQNDLGERALIVLADGMGGCAAGEVAAALAIDGLKQYLLQQPLFAGLVGEPGPAPAEFDALACQETMVAALREVNRQIYTAARTPGKGRRGMGCTAEVLYLDGRRLVLGHVGDSRTYHYRAGRLTQVTRDQTLVNRLVELKQLTEEEAEQHPRRNELQQALGGLPAVDPLTYHVELQPGDWVVVCSDGLTNHVDRATLTEMIQRADSAEMLARRLVNLANLKGGSDNCTVVAVRAT